MCCLIRTTLRGAISIELNGVTLEEALEIIALESKTFWRPVTPNTIFVAADNPAKRKELEQSVIKTFYLVELSQPTELQDVVNAMRRFWKFRRIQPLPSQSAIVVRGTPDQIALAEKLVDDLDKAKPEVIVDVAIMQVSRDKMHNLGINPPTSTTVALQNNINTTHRRPTARLPGQTQLRTTGGTPNQVNLNRLGNLNATDFTVTIPQAIGHGDVQRQHGQAVAEPANSRGGWPEGFPQNRRPAAGGDGFVPAGHRRRGNQPAGQYAVSISTTSA